MTEPLKLDSSGIDKFILKAALKEEPIFDSYKKLCTAQGSPLMDYKDFERKYYQFYNGNYELTIKKCTVDVSPVTFSDLPIVVLKKVVTGLSLVDCLALRKVSHGLRNLVDSTETYCERIWFRFRDNHWGIKLRDSELSYRKTDDEMCNFWCISKEYKDDRNFQEVMIADASTFLKNPKLKIDNLHFEVLLDTDSHDSFTNYLKSLSFQLDVRSICVQMNERTALPILQFLKPETLEEIFIDSQHTDFEILDDFTGMQQWKKAKKLYWEWFPGGVQSEKFLHFQEVYFLQISWADENLMMVRDILHQSTRMDYCYLTFDYPDDEDEDGKEKIARIMRQNPAFDPNAWRFSIPNSRDYFQLEFKIDDNEYDYDRRESLRITKILRN